MTLDYSTKISFQKKKNTLTHTLKTRNEFLIKKLILGEFVAQPKTFHESHSNFFLKVYNVSNFNIHLAFMYLVWKKLLIYKQNLLKLQECFSKF